MTTQEHVNYAIRTLPDLGKDKETQLERIVPEQIGIKLNLSHMALGLAGELGEIVNCTGTELKHKIDLTNLEEELGDQYWYLSCYCHLRNVPVPHADHLKVDIENDLCFELLISSISDLVDLVKRYTAYNKEIDRAKELETVYNIYVSLFLFESIYQLDGNKIREKNINKLRVRYPQKYSDDSAINRNIEAERKSLES
jgi:NTP pyrophosphatase (non-canonical NTP hydrolase)